MTYSEKDLDDLPVGSVVLAKDAHVRDLWPWSKTDDTTLFDENGNACKTAWVSAGYTDELTSANLLAQSSDVTVLWNSDTPFDPAAHDAEVRADERAKIVGRLRGTGPTWEAVVAELAKIAERNMPGWDAGEMAITALRIVGERIVEAGR